MRISAGALALCLVVPACGAVDVTPEVTAFSSSVSKATASLEGDLTSLAAGEAAAARAAAVAAGERLYDPPLTCVLAASDTKGFKPDDCKLEPRVTAPFAPGSATAMLAYTNMLKSYAEALTMLAISKEPDAVAKAFGSVVGAAEDLAAAVPDMAPQAKQLAKANPPLTKLGARLAEVQRLRLIRTLVRDAAPGVNEALDRLIAYRDEADGLLATAVGLDEAYARMDAAMQSGNGAAYATEVAAYEAQHAQLQDRLARSDAGRLILIRDAQAKLEARLKEPGKLTEFIELIETLKALSNALEQ